MLSAAIANNPSQLVWVIPVIVVLFGGGVLISVLRRKK
jgi:cytochrome c-type biogenesis protein CcmH/NrfF